MNQKKIIIQLLIGLIPMITIGQPPTVNKPPQNKFAFHPPKKKKTKFRQKYLGAINGQPMELGFVEKTVDDQLTLTVTLTDVKQQKVYLGTAEIDKKDHYLQKVVLQHQQKDTLVISQLFRHLYNPNFINLIMGNGAVGNFSGQGTNLPKPNYQPKAFSNQTDFLGNYTGRLNGRLAVLRMEQKEQSLNINLYDQELKKSYQTTLPALPIGESPFILENISLKSANKEQDLLISQLYLDTTTTSVASGWYITNLKKVGIFFNKNN